MRRGCSCFSGPRSTSPCYTGPAYRMFFAELAFCPARPSTPLPPNPSRCTQGERVVSALSGGRAQRAWALNVLLVLSFRQELRLGATPGLLAALLPVRWRCAVWAGLGLAWEFLRALAGRDAKFYLVALSSQQLALQPPVAIQPQARLCAKAQSAVPPLPSPASLQVLQEGLAAAVGLSTASQPALPSEDDIREQLGLPPLPGWQARRAARLCTQLFPDPRRVAEQLEEAAAAAVVLRNAADVQQNSALLLDPPVMRCWTWCLNAARELVLQRDKPEPHTEQPAQPQGQPGGGGDSGGVAGGTNAPASPAAPASVPEAAGADQQAAAAAAAAAPAAGTSAAGAAAGGSQLPAASLAQGLDWMWDREDLLIDIGGGPAADICTSLLQVGLGCGAS